MKVLLTPIGSYGDVHPYVGIGMSLQQRGHEVTLITNAQFEPLARQVGLKFVASSSREKYLEAVREPDLWHPRRGFATAMTLVFSQIEELYHLIQAHHEPGRSMLLGHSLALASIVAKEKLGIPLLGVHLAPAMFRSVHVPPVMHPRLDLAWFPRWMQRWLWWEVDRHLVDPVVCPALNHWRWELGLPAVHRPFKDWIHPPDGVLGLWPDWFAPAQPDWPSQVTLTGFPLYDESGVAAMPADLNAFLKEGSPPIIFTPGSAMMHGQTFFTAAIEACQRMNRRGVLLTRYAEQLPARLPSDIRHVEFVPLSQILPHACAFVHHGGIGSCAQGLAAGVPQLITPLSHDQPDNAARLKRLGAGDWLAARKITGQAFAQSLGKLIDVPEVWARCKALAMKCQQQQGREEACLAIEAFGRRMGVND